MSHIVTSINLDTPTQIKECLSNTSNYIIPVNKTITDKIGLDPAVVLLQIKYWTEKCGRSMQGEQGDWIYNSLDEWHKQFSYWSMSKLRRIIKLLEDKELIFTNKLNAIRYNHTKWYSINFNKFNKLFSNAKPIARKPLLKTTTRPVKNEQILYKETKTTKHITPYPLKRGNGDNNNFINPERKRKTSKAVFAEHTAVRNKDSDTLQTLSLKLNPFIDSWNKKFTQEDTPQIPIILTARRARKINKILDKYFSFDLNKWESFLSRIASSNFLMGKVNPFKASFDWVLREGNLLKIREGKYVNLPSSWNNHKENEYISAMPTPKESQAAEETFRAEIINLKHSSSWKSLLQKARLRYGLATTVSWFTKLKLIDRGTRVLLLAPTRFIKEWIETYYQVFIEQELGCKVAVAT